MKKLIAILIDIIGNALFFAFGIMFIWFRNNAETKWGPIACVILGIVFCIFCGLSIHLAIEEWRKLRKVDQAEIDEFWCNAFNTYLLRGMNDAYADSIKDVGGIVIYAAYLADNKTLETYLNNATALTRTSVVGNNAKTVAEPAKYALYDGKSMHIEVINEQL